MPEVHLPHQWMPRDYQLPLWRYMHGGGKRAIVIWPRRHGKDDVALHYTACAAHERVGVYWHLLPQQNQARKAIWDAINPHTGRRRIDDAFPKSLREATREQDMMIRLKVGSTWQVIGSDNYDALVGTPPVGVVFSEYALSNPQAWSLVRPILAENGGWAMFITTPRGRNHAHRMFQLGELSDDWFAERLVATDTGVFDAETLANERAELVQERGEEDGDAIYQQEYMTSFSAGLPGAYYAKIIDRLEADGRLTSVPYNPQAQVHTAWDLGRNDQTVIWFIQRHGLGWAVIDYIANTSVGIDWYVREVREKPYSYGEHLLPHDAENELLVSATGSIADTVRGMGLKGVRIVPRTASVANDINEVRQVLPLCWFDRAKCSKGLDALRSYRRVWDEKLRAYRDTPLHDWASDPCFTGDTEVLTPHGTRRIDALPHEGEVLTSWGWKKYADPRITRENASLVAVTFNDGLTVRCTPEHMFKTASGWKSASQLTPGIVIRSGWTSLPNSSRASFTVYGRRVPTFHVVVALCIGTCGRALSAIYQRVATYITETLILGTTLLRILSAWGQQTIFPKLGIIAVPAGQNQSSATRPVPLRLTGIAPMRGVCGTSGMLNAHKAGRNGNASQSHAVGVAKNIKRWFANQVTLASGARKSVSRPLITSVVPISEPQDVWCLTVEQAGEFSLANGALVHNCDAFRTFAIGKPRDAANNNRPIDYGRVSRGIV